MLNQYAKVVQQCKPTASAVTAPPVMSVKINTTRILLEHAKDVKPTVMSVWSLELRRSVQNVIIVISWTPLMHVKDVVIIARIVIGLALQSNVQNVTLVTSLTQLMYANSVPFPAVLYAEMIHTNVAHVPLTIKQLLIHSSVTLAAIPVTLVKVTLVDHQLPIARQ
jgi:hypothetical protein